MTNEVPKHMVRMGILIVNLQSLEFALRAFLYNDEAGCKKDTKPEFLENIKYGDQVPENAFTNYDSLRELIKKYNGKIRSYDLDLCIVEDLVCIRDALAHGRIASKVPSTNEPCKLVKYDKSSNGKVRVTHCVILTKDWFDREIKRVYEAIQKASKANEKFHNTSTSL